MKKILYIMVLSVILIGCASLNTPTSKVEELLMKYQKNDKEVLNDLDKAVSEEMTFTEVQRERYRELVKKNYKDMTYEIKDETIDGDKSTVKVEIEVIDYTKVMNETNIYFQANPNEFVVDGEYDPNKFIEYRLDELEKTKDKVKYTLDIKLRKTNNKWVLDSLSEESIEKLNGTYKY